MENMDAFPSAMPQPAQLEALAYSSASAKEAGPATSSLDAAGIKLKARVYKSDLFKSLEPFLMKLFTQTAIAETDYTLTSRQDQIFQSILSRKFNKRIPVDKLDAPLTLKTNIVNTVINTSFKKRPEECYKYFTIRILKFAKDSLSKDSDHPVTDEEMYERIFGEIAKKQGVSLREFYYPLNKQAGSGAKLNSKYFDKLRMSPQFMALAREYLTTQVHSEHVVEVSQKLFSLLKPHDQSIRKRKKTEDQCFTDLLAYIDSNKHCKFPWTMKELKESQDKFEAMIFSRGNCDETPRTF